MQIEEKALRTAQSIVFLTIGVAIASCAAGSKARLTLDPREVSAEPPFELTITLGASQAAIGEIIKVTYFLQNRSNQPAAACPDGWDEFQVVNVATKANRGLVHASTAVDTNSAIRLAPDTTLTWVREVEIPDVGVGEAQLFGRFSSGCGEWVGQLWSKPVTINLVSNNAAAK